MIVSNSARFRIIFGLFVLIRLVYSATYSAFFIFHLNCNRWPVNSAYFYPNRTFGLYLLDLNLLLVEFVIVGQ
jgi:hypothetical protein